MARDAYQGLRAAEAAIPLVPEKGENAAAANAIRAIQRQIGSAAEHFATLRKAMAPFRNFLAPANLRGIALWSRHNDCADDLAGAVTFGHNKLAVAVRDENFRLVVPSGLAGFEVPDLNEVARLLKLT